VSVGEPAEGKNADLIVAANTALDHAIHAMRPGTKPSAVTAIIEGVAKDFGVVCVEGALSHQMKRYIIDGAHVIANADKPDQRVFDDEIETATVWCLDIAFSSGIGELREEEARCAMYKRSLDSNYQLKLKTSKEVFRDIENNFQTFPFAVRHLDAKKGPFGVRDCMNHNLVVPYPVLWEKSGIQLAQVKATILVTGNKIDKVTNNVTLPEYKSEKTLENADVKAWKEKSLTLKKKKRGGGKGKKKTEENAAAAGE